MPTKNPKVSGYVSAELSDALKKFARDRGVSESKALGLILAEYFGIGQNVGPVQGRVDPEQIAALESAIVDLQQRVESLEAVGDSGGTAPSPTQASQQPSQPVSRGATNLPSPKTKADGMGIAEALIAANASVEFSPGNHDRAMQAHYGMKAREWLLSQGWQQQGRKWFRPTAINEG